jgi:uncharacterized membrane protein
MTKPSTQGERFRAGLLRVANAAYSAFKFLFKVSIMVVLIGYFVLFLLIFIAVLVGAIAALFRGSDSDVDFDFDLGWVFDLLFWFWWISPPPTYQVPQPTRRPVRKARKRRTRPFYRDVFAFVFGEEEEKEDPLAEGRQILDFVREHQGRLTAADLVALTGCTLAEADDRLLKLMVDYQGDVEVTEEGALVYTFDRLMPTLQQSLPEERQWAYCWERPEETAMLNRNSKSTNGWIIFFNLFNLAWASLFTFLAASGGFHLTSGEIGPVIGLAIFPLVFSLLFFLIPILRKVKLNRENVQRAHRNRLRRLLEYLYERYVLRHPTPEQITPEDVVRSGVNIGSSVAIQQELDRMLTDYEGELELTDEGGTHYTFPRLRREASGVEEFRRMVAPEEFEVQEVVFTSEE